MTIFTKIINGEIPSHKIYENDLIYVFMDAFPIREGHVLIVPKIEVDYFVNLDDKYYNEVFRVAKLITPAIEKSIDCLRVGMCVEGMSVPHFHLHLIPIVKNTPMFGQNSKVDDRELKITCDKIKENLLSLKLN